MKKRISGFAIALALLIPLTLYTAQAQGEEASPAQAEPAVCCGTDRDVLQGAHDVLLQRKAAQLQKQLGIEPVARDDDQASLFETIYDTFSDSSAGWLMPSTGTVKILVIPILYPDRPDLMAGFDREITDTQFFAPYDPSKDVQEQSVRGYYHMVSHGKLDMIGDVMEPYLAPESSSYYFSGGRDEFGTPRQRQLVKDAVSYYSARGIDLSKYDSDENKILDAVFVQSYGPGFTAHAAWGSELASGYALGPYALAPALQGFDGSRLLDSERSVACHELGHCLGMHDHYYDSDIDNRDRNVFDTNLEERMASGRYINAYYQYLLGWIDPVILTEEDAVTDLSLSPIESVLGGDPNSPQAVVFIPSPRVFPFAEYYLVEYRTGTISASFFKKNPGLLIWHVNAMQDGGSGYKNRANYLQPVYKSGAEKYSEGDVYIAGDELSASTTPSSAFYDGAETGIYLKVTELTPEKADIRAGFLDPPKSPEPVVEVTIPSKKVIQRGEHATVEITAKLGDELIELTEEQAETLKSYVATGTVPLKYAASWSASTNPMTVTLYGDVPSINETPDGTIRVEIPAGAVRYKEKDSAAVKSEVVYIDNSPPEITLLGMDPQIAWLGEPYRDPGATVADLSDPNIAEKLVVDSSRVDTNTPGTYKVVYSATDHAGHTASVERTVRVEERTSHIHSWSNEWMQDGNRHWRECTACGEAGFQAEHTPVVDPAIPATHGTEGKTEGSHCETCGYVIVPQTRLPALGHAYRWVSDRTGHWQECDCGETTVKSAHTILPIPAVEPTCIDEGKTEGSHCPFCSYVSKEPVAVPALGHDYSPKWITTAKVHHHRCNRCNRLDLDTLGNHVPVVDPAIPATCTTSGKREGSHCEVCGYVTLPQAIIPATGHSYSGDWTADETDHWLQCANCDAVDRQAAHIENSGTVTTAPTLEMEGVKAYACSVCGHVMRTETLPRLESGHSHTYAENWTWNAAGHWHECECGDRADSAAHIPVIDPAVEADCITDGKTEGSHCEVCGYVILPQTTVLATGHSYSADWTADETGHWHKCKNCDGTTDVVAHTLVIDPAISATCTKDGLTEGSHCQVCRFVLKAQLTDPAPGHSYGADWIVEGGKHWRECLKCKATTDAEYHTSDGGKVTKAPTLEETGIRTYTCVICGEIMLRELMPKLRPEEHAHTPVIDPAVSATCTTDGKTEGSHCKECGDVIKEAIVIPATGHSYSSSEWVSNKTMHWHNCETCGKTDMASIAAHVPVIDPAIEATCTTDGKTEGSHCEVCGYAITPQTVVPATGHRYSANWTGVETGHGHQCADCGDVANVVAHTVVMDPAFPATCTADGRMGDGSHCSECGYVIKRATVIPAPGHRYPSEWVSNKTLHWHNCETCGKTDMASIAAHVPVIDPAIEATCTTDGKTEGSHCDICGYVITAQTAVPATGHHYAADWSSDETGHWHKCENCDSITDRADHSEDAGTVTQAPTLEETGIKTYACSVCGYVMRAETLPKLEPEHTHNYGQNWTSDGTGHWHECVCGERADAAAHAPVIDPAVEADCTTDGKTAGSHCDICGYVITAQVTVPATGHHYGQEWKTDEANHWHECVCGEQMDAAAHTPVTDPAIEATCTTDGKTEGSHCGVCGYVITVQVVVPATGHHYAADWSSDEENHWYACACGETSNHAAHSYGDWSTVQTPTVAAEGGKERICTVCGHTQTQAIPPLGFEFSVTGWQFRDASGTVCDAPVDGGTLDAVTLACAGTAPDALVIVAVYSGGRMTGVKLLDPAGGVLPVGLRMDSDAAAKAFVLHRSALAPCAVPFVWGK